MKHPAVSISITQPQTTINKGKIIKGSNGAPKYFKFTESMIENFKNKQMIINQNSVVN